MPNCLTSWKRRKTIRREKPEDYGVSTASNIQIVKVTPPAERKAGVKVKSVDELVDKLRNEAKVI